MKTKFDWNIGESGLADISQDALKNYFVYGLPPGSFLTSLLSNDPWTEVIGRADHWNKPILGRYLEWLYKLAPPNSWGSREIVEDWLNKGEAYQAYQQILLMEILKEES